MKENTFSNPSFHPITLQFQYSDYKFDYTQGSHRLVKDCAITVNGELLA